jgi:adenylate cyclase
MRVGVATGEVMVGDFGNPPRNSSYTVLGDTANLASRLEGANKAFNSRILTTGITRAAVLASAPADVAGWLWRPIGRINVKGKNEAVEMWELIGTLRPKGDRTEEHVRACARLVDAYVAGDLGGAAAALDDLESAFGPDAFTHLYREGLALIRDGHAAAGTLILTEK